MTAESLEERQLELADKIVTVLAPPGWSDARVEAWLGEDPTLFEDHAAIGRPAGVAATCADIDSIEFEAAVQDHLARARAAEAAAGAASVTAARLTAVIDAFGRCEGEPEACADPRRNAALARAARSAREAGVTDSLILRAIALAKAGETAWQAAEPLLAPTPWLIGAGAREDVEAGARPAARIAAGGWETGRVVLALGAHDAEAAARALGAPRAAIDVRAFFREDGDDLEGFAATVKTWTGTLDERADGEFRPVGLTLGGVADHLVARGLTFGGEDGCAEAAGLFALAAGAALEASADLARAHGPYPEFANERAAALASIQDRLDQARALPPGPLAEAATAALTAALKAARKHGLPNSEVV